MDSVNRGNNRRYEEGLISQAESVKAGDEYYLHTDVSGFRHGDPFLLVGYGKGAKAVVKECDPKSPDMVIEIEMPLDIIEGTKVTKRLPFSTFFNFFSPSRRQGSGDPIEMGDERMLKAVDPEGGFKGRKNDSFTVDDIRRIAFEKVSARIRGENVGFGGSKEPEES